MPLRTLPLWTFAAVVSLLMWLPTALTAQESAATPSSPPLQAFADTLSACEPALTPLEPLTSPLSRIFLPAARIIGAAPADPGFIRRPSSEWGTPVCDTFGQRGMTATADTGTGPRLSVLPVRTYAVRNTGYPDDRNNGALWAGRGWSGTAEAGAAMRWGAFSAALYPTVAYQENLAFEMRPVPEPLSPFANPFYGSIDLPQRFGDQPYWTLHPGLSFARVDAFGAAAGISMENSWWGPGHRYSLLMSNTGPGFPHAFLGTSGPVDVWIGRLEAEAVWGRLTRSEYVEPTSPDENLLVGLVLSFEPRGLPGLSLGLARVYVQPPEAAGFRDYFPFFDPFLKKALATPDDPQGNDLDNQLAAVYARWVLPESGFEVYAEWGREDHSHDFEDLAEEPDHSQAYLLGFQKMAGGGELRVRLTGELVHLQENRPAIDHRSTGVWYTNSSGQSYTHHGQLIGSATGPGSDAQMLGIDVLGGWGLFGVYAERVRRNDRSVPAAVGRLKWPFEHDVELSGGFRQLARRGDLELTSELRLSHRYNRDFIPVPDTPRQFADDSNVAFSVGLSWRPRNTGF